MLSRFHLTAALFGLFLAEPARRPPPGRPPIVDVDIGALTVDADLTVFMRKDVPEDVRWAALRRLWVLMQLPVFCHKLCYEAETAGSGLAQLAIKKLSVAAQ